MFYSGEVICRGKRACFVVFRIIIMTFSELNQILKIQDRLFLTTLYNTAVDRSDNVLVCPSIRSILSLKHDCYWVNFDFTGNGVCAVVSWCHLTVAGYLLKHTPPSFVLEKHFGILDWGGYSNNVVCIRTYAYVTTEIYWAQSTTLIETHILTY